MKYRLFAFGCSYTRYRYPTWADYLGVEFEEYYNYGRSGSSNTYIMNKFVEAMLHFNFSKTDMVVIMLTGFGRFSYIDKESSHWMTLGDLYYYIDNTKNPVLSNFVNHMFSDDFAVYQSWVAAKTIKKILTLQEIPHKIFMSIDNSMYFTDTVNLSAKTIQKTNEVYEMLDYKTTFDEWKQLKPENNQYPIWLNNEWDGHPSLHSHYVFFKEQFKNYPDKKAIELKNYWEKNFDARTPTHQGNKFEEEFVSKYNLASKITLY
jgi:hypothetical protein